MKSVLGLIFVLLIGLFSAPVLAITEVYNDKVKFLTLTGADIYNEPYPDGVQGISLYTSRFVTFSTPPGSTLDFRQWTNDFAGPDLALSGRENLDVEIIAPVNAIGFEIIEDGPPSTFEVSLIRKDEVNEVVTVEIDSSTRFVGIWTDTGFDRIQIRETADDGTNEYFGDFYGSTKKNRDQSSNLGALICQFPLLAAYAFSTGASFVAPPPADDVASYAAYAANLALKYCPPWAKAPADIITLADNPSHPNPNSAAACYKTFDHERIHSGYTNMLGIRVSWDKDWGELGTPKVIHQNTDVEVYMQRGLSPPITDTLSLSSLLGDEIANGGIYSDCDDETEISPTGHLCPKVKDRELKFPVGRSTIGYRFDVNMGILDLLYIEVPKFPQGTKNKAMLDLAAQLLAEILVTAVDLTLGGWRFGNYVDRFQQVIVRDLVPPTIAKASGDFNDDGVVNAADLAFIDNVVIEADEVGGVSASRYRGFVSSMWDISDNCNRSASIRATYPSKELRTFWPVNTTAEDNSFELSWEASDAGPNLNGLPNRVMRSHTISVVDTRPPVMQPPPDIVELTNASSVTIDLGQPLVFDLVDLSPEIVNDAVFPLSAGLHEITWTATDASGNATSVIQSVNIKNSNIEPEALAQTGGSRENAISFEPQEILLAGFDADADPLNFFIEDYPENGFFVAPLYPYFIEDYRVEATLDDNELRQICQDRWAMGQGAPFHAEQIRNPIYFSSTDDGRTYVMDYGYVRCQEDRGLAPKYEVRIALFDPSGQFVTAENRSKEPDDMYIDSRNDLIYLTTGEQTNGSINVLDDELNTIQAYNLFSIPDQNAASDTYFFDGNIEYARSAVLDSKGVLYVLDTLGDVYAVRADTPGESPVRPEFIGIALETSNSGTQFDMAIDTEDNLYVSMDDRIYKVSASTVDENGDFVVGSLIGWMGKCTSDTAPGDQAVCDVANERSLGYSCTDEFCGGAGLSGSAPGQFNDPRGIAIDPKDNLYVTDYNNLRVQRFTPDGFFAGQAESACEGNCFVLGDFGRPNDIAVNSTHFYILDPDTDLLHVSQTSPFLEIGDDYAIVEYQSNNDFACMFSLDCIDSFSFSVSDGVRDPDTGQMMRSAPAQVQVEVERNFRAPFATPGIVADAPEEISTPIVLDGSDPDPLDSLMFEITQQPLHGTISLSGNTATYTSDIDYNGEDLFGFTVDDGSEVSAPETVVVTVTDVNDPPVLGIDEDLRAGRGFVFRLNAELNDPDPADRHRIAMDWGDGTPLQPEGEILQDGETTGPVLMQTPSGLGNIIAEHVFESTGLFDTRVCVDDRIEIVNDEKVLTADSISVCLPASVEVVDMVDVTIEVNGPDALTRGESNNYVITVANREPDSGAGLTATGLQFSMEVDPVLVTIAPAGCSLSNNEINCALNNLPPGASQDITVPVIVPGATGNSFQVSSEVNVLVSQEDISDINKVLVTTPLLSPGDFLIGGIGANELIDDYDPALGDGICEGADTGACNLRSAIMESNAMPGTQTISLGNQVFTLSQTGSGGGNWGNGDLDVAQDLKIIGNGPANTYINAAGIDRVIEVWNGATLELEGVSVTGGFNNDSESIFGGGIEVKPGGTLILRNVHVFDNEGIEAGGGIYSQGVMVIENSTISGNVSDYGAGIYNLGDLTLINTTLSGNEATNSGGGLYADPDSVTIINSTIAGNRASFGGGLYMEPGRASITLRNSLIADNMAPGAPDCSSENGNLISDGGNLIGIRSGCSFNPAASDILDANPRIGVLEDNGGPTPTHALEEGSPAIDRGLNVFCPASDQRGRPRPADGIGNGLAICDIGAFEVPNMPLSDLIFRDSFE